MRLGDLIDREEVEGTAGGEFPAGLEIRSVAYHSENVEKGSLFFAIQGEKDDGAKYIAQAAARGAAACVLSGPPPPAQAQPAPGAGIPLIFVRDARAALARAAAAFWGRPAEKLTLIGVTGTKGKTTTAFMIRAILEEAGIKTGIISTALCGWSGRLQAAEATTPQAPEINRLLAQMVEAGCKAAVMEVSSQGLMHSRVAGLKFDTGAFMNIYPDHIGRGEHRSFEEYLYWKSTLFRCVRRAVINKDDAHAPAILRESRAEETIFFGGGEADYAAAGVVLTIKGGKLGVSYDLLTRPAAGPGRRRRI